MDEVRLAAAELEWADEEVEGLEKEALTSTCLANSIRECACASEG